ncbi:MAG: cell wall hydrolase [Gammaproteobacteria bacterium]|nr:cell wall hydrolase [Gammaproteobacteria bacterium]
MFQTITSRRLAGRPAAALAAVAAVLSGCAGPAARSFAQDIPDARVAPAGPASLSPEELRCMALSLYWEARSEGEEGMIAVGSVVLNRVASSDFPNSVCAVVFQGGETPPCQFSWWCDGKSDTPREAELWRIAQQVASRLLSNAESDPTGGALFFHSADIDVPWRVPRERTARIRNHVYYR